MKNTSNTTSHNSIIRTGRAGSSTRTCTLSTLWIATLLLLCTVLGSSPALAKVVTVTNPNDSGAGSLRTALASAATGDTVNFSFNFGTINLTKPLTITKSLTLSGPNTGYIGISGQNNVEVLIVNPGIVVNISWLAIQNGNANIGGCILNDATLTLTDVVVTACKNPMEMGGGIFNAGTLSLVSSTVTGNFAGPHNTYYGGGDNAQILGAGAGIFNYLGTLNVANTTISQNFTSGPLDGSTQGGGGAGIFNYGGTVSVNNSTITQNYSSVGAGIENMAGTVAVTNTTFWGNSASGTGGAIENESSGMLTVTNSTLAKNVALADPAQTIVALPIPGSNSGSQCPPSGCILAVGIIGGGGGLRNTGNASLTNVTITGNSVANASTGGGMANGGNLTVKNSLLALNGEGNCNGSQYQIISQGHNLSDDMSCIGEFNNSLDLNDVAAGLDTAGLKNNGGTTLTVALLATSRAVDAIPLSACTDTTGVQVKTDQRGTARPQGSACDIGAFEYVRPKVVIVPPGGPIEVAGK